MKKIISIIFVLIVLFGFGFLYYNSQNNKVLVGNKDNTNTNMNSNKKIKIIAAGDSLTAGYGLLESESYPSQLQEKIDQNNLDAQVINAGISGETSKGLLSRIDFLKNEKADIYIITTGGNDALRNLPIEDTKKNIDQILVTLKEVTNEDNIILLRIQAPLNLGLSYVNNFNNMYDELGKKNSVRVVDFVVEDVFLKPNLMLPDGIHPNKDGYKILVDEYIFPEVSLIIENK